MLDIRSKLFALLLMPFVVFAEGIIVDPITNPFIQITCDYPVERENGDSLGREEIANVSFYVTTLSEPEWREPVLNLEECLNIIDTTALLDDQYYVTATVTDTEARESTYAINSLVTKGVVAFEVKRGVVLPLPPQNIVLKLTF